MSRRKWKARIKAAEVRAEEAEARARHLEGIQKAYDLAINRTQHRKAMVAFCHEVNAAVRQLRGEAP